MRHCGHVLLCLLSLLSIAHVRADDATTALQFLAQHCSECHSKENAETNLALVDIGIDFSNAAQADVWQRVHEQIVLGEMPPADARQPTSEGSERITRWIADELRKAGQTPNVEHKLRSPQFGNYVNHEKLFDGSQKGPAFSPPRLWRMSPYLYDQFVDTVGRHLRRETAIHQPFPLEENKGQIADFAAPNFAAAPTLQLLMMNCETIAKFQTTGISKRDHNGETHLLKDTPPEFEQIVQSKSLPTEEQISAAVQRQYQLLLERPATDSEQKQLIDFCRKAIRTGGNARGLQTTLMAILLKPEAVYRMEIGLGPVDQFGRRKLSEVELAFALAHALTDKGPSKIEIGNSNLLDLVQSGKLSTPKEIQHAVIRILSDNDMSTADYRMFTEDHQVRNTRVLRFFREFFGYHHAPKVFKDEKRIGHGETYRTERIVDDADQLVMHIFDEDKNVLRRLLTTDEYFVSYLGSLEHIQKDMHYIKTNVNDANFEFNTKYVQQAEAAGRHPIPIEGPDSRMYVGFYNLDHESWDYPTKQPFRMPGGKRMGLLTHPAWLIAWSGNFDNDPIRRGKWIREHLLADTIPDVPLDVNAVVPEDRNATLRKRLSVTRDEYCWTCHKKMDPLGLPFERYDDFGRHRSEEMIGELLSVFPERHQEADTKSIDANGEITESGETNLDGEVENAFELVQKLADSERVRQSFVRHAFRYWMGRNETLNDSPTLIAADRAYVGNGGSMKWLIASLLSSDSFLYRKEKTP